jgi:rhodanese-related sulfurtransferase
VRIDERPATDRQAECCDVGRVGVIAVIGFRVAGLLHRLLRRRVRAELTGNMMMHQGTEAERISTSETEKKLAAKENTLLLDVRTPEEFAGPSGHLRDAMLIPVQELDARMDELAPYRDRTIIVYCRTAHRSGIAAKMLNARGFRALNMSGGIVQWNAEGRPVEHGGGQ